MIGKYDGRAYHAAVFGDEVSLSTRKQEKRLENFESKRDYFKTTVSLSDSNLSDVFEIHFWVLYRDDAEGKRLWLVDENRAVGEKPDVDANKVVIDVNHDGKNDSWIGYDKGAASKTIFLTDCEEYVVERRFLKRNGIMTNDVERTSMSLEDFKKTIVATRKTEL